jgi:micrococcal nuclease
VGAAGVRDGTLRGTAHYWGELPLLFFSGLPPVRAAWLAGFPPSTVRHVSMALRCVQEAILSAKTVPWLTTASHVPLVSPSFVSRGRTHVLALCYLLFLFSPFRAVADFSGPVVSVLDGDTLEVLHNHHLERIRLSGIDCLEKGQAYRKRAKQAVSALVFGKEVTLQTYDRDKYGRTLADMLLPNGTNVNHTLVKEGWCWWYRKYAPWNTTLDRLETEAREARRGLWVEPNPIPPWEWRRLGRSR